MNTNRYVYAEQHHDKTLVGIGGASSHRGSGDSGAMTVEVVPPTTRELFANAIKALGELFAHARETGNTVLAARVEETTATLLGPMWRAAQEDEA